MDSKNKLFNDFLNETKLEIKKGYKGRPSTLLEYKRKSKSSKRVKKKEIKRFKPGNIDNGFFWKEVHENFGTLAISNKKASSVEEVNNITLDMSNRIGLLPEIKKAIKNKKDFKILEIGSGYGNFHDWLKSEHFNMDNYYSIDVYEYFNHKNLFITDGNSFPENLPKFDIIYSCNVFQHLTQKQRRMYYKNISKHLNDDGIFYGANIIRHPVNKDSKDLWGVKNKKGIDYVSFFGQYTKVEKSKKFEKDLMKFGLEAEYICYSGNLVSYKVYKLN